MMVHKNQNFNLRDVASIPHSLCSGNKFGALFWGPCLISAPLNLFLWILNFSQI